MSTDIRPELSPRNPWYIPKHRYYELKHFCLQYPDWKKELKDLIYHGKKTGRISSENVEWKDPVGDVACMIDHYKTLIDMVESSAYESDVYLGRYILKAVTQDISFTTLKMVYDIPCGKDMYYDRYRKFFFILDAKKTMRNIGRMNGRVNTQEKGNRQRSL